MRKFGIRTKLAVKLSRTELLTPDVALYRGDSPATNAAARARFDRFESGEL